MYDLKKYINPHNIKSVFAKTSEGKSYRVTEYDCECSFDIETTTIYDIDENGKRCNDRAYMYVWQFGIGHYPDDYQVIYGRTWDEFKKLLEAIETMKSPSYKLYIYVHNLPFEFQFMKDRINWKMDRNGNASIFATEARKVIKAETEGGIVFRDSLILSGGKSLATVGEELTKYKVKKMVGDLDYEKKRNSMTPLTEEEYMYCLNDVKVVMAYIREEKERYGSTTNIPMTNTGRVREDVKNAMKWDSDYNKNKHRTAINYPEYNLLATAYSGGFTHANPTHSCEELENVTSIDFTSSYPAVMMSELYPSGDIIHFKSLTIEDVDKMDCLWVARYSFKHIRLKEGIQDGIIASAHCEQSNLLCPIVVNGKVFFAMELTTSGTNIDFNDIRMFYDFDDCIIEDVMMWTEKKPLPYQTRKTIAKYYKAKTELKGVEGQEAEYMLKKGMLNSLYGMMVTSLLNESHIYDTEECIWYRRENDYRTKCEIIRKNQGEGRFCDYANGLFVTSYGRHNLYTGLLEMGWDYIYSDTDSIKLLNLKKHMKYIEEYNKRIVEKLIEVNGEEFYTKFLLCKTKTGEVKPLGVWDIEGTYKRFKALRAKAYLAQEEDGRMVSTIAGLNKAKGSAMFQRELDEGRNPFDLLTLQMKVSEEDCGKLTKVYNDSEHSDIVTDLQGNRELMHEYSSVALHPVGFEMNEDTNLIYASLLNTIQKERNR